MIYDQIAQFKNNMEYETNLRIPILTEKGETIGSLRCVDKLFISPGWGYPVSALMCKWRAENMQWFLTHFVATPDRTQKWLEEVIIPAKDRIMFLVCAADGQLIGNYGIRDITPDHGQLDNGLRGEKGGPKGLMHYADISILSWMFWKMGMKTANLWLFAHNDRVLKWHQETGFIAGRKVPLYVHYEENGDRVYSTQGDPAEISGLEYLEVTITPEQLLAKHPWVKEQYVDRYERTM